MLNKTPTRASIKLRSYMYTYVLELKCTLMSFSVFSVVELFNGGAKLHLVNVALFVLHIVDLHFRFL